MLKDGCTVFLARNEDRSFEGETHPGECGSELHGASYTTSEVRVMAERLISWDRGWDTAGNQVWGAEDGGYVFDRITPGRHGAIGRGALDRDVFVG